MQLKNKCRKFVRMTKPSSRINGGSLISSRADIRQSLSRRFTSQSL